MNIKQHILPVAIGSLLSSTLFINNAFADTHGHKHLRANSHGPIGVG